MQCEFGSKLVSIWFDIGFEPNFGSNRSLQQEMKREKPITVKGLLDNGSRLSPPNNDDYMVRSRETTEVTAAAANFHTLLKRVVLPLSLSLHRVISSTS